MMLRRDDDTTPVTWRESGFVLSLTTIAVMIALALIGAIK